MRRYIVVFLCALGLLLGAKSSLANIAVGTCRPALPSYPTISLAVAAAPAFSTVVVCPGTYPEQVVITTPLTLQGVTSANSNQAVVAVPSGGSSANVTSIFGESVAAQVLVMASPVNIINITVDGTGNNLAGTGVWLAGIFYASGSSGTVNNATARNQVDSGLGIGIWAENGTATVEEVTIENNSVHDVDGSGIFTATFSPSTLTAPIKGNTVAIPGIVGIESSAAGAITNNVITAGQYGIYRDNSPVTVSENMITNPGDFVTYGIVTFSADTITFNRVSSTFYDIYLTANGANVQSNSLDKAANGIEFNCSTVAAVAHNTINDVLTGLDSVPDAFSGVGLNTFYNTATIKANTCGFAPTSGRAAKPKIPKDPAHPFAE